MKKLFLLDAMALIYRAHFAFIRNPRYNSKGLNTSAVFGFTNTLLEVLAKEKPTHIAIAFDTPEPTFRHIQFAEYKAHRDAQPEDISLAIPYIKKMMEAMNIQVIEKAGFEADDIVGTIAYKAADEGFYVYMMTSDKDYCQLVRDNIFVYKPASGFSQLEILGVKEVLDKWNIKQVSQVTDILGLQGDASDNIPGIPGIGEKTAKKLIEEYETVENLIQNADKLSGKQKENIVQFAQQGLLSKQLATIKVDVEVDFDADLLQCKDFNKNKLSEIFDDLEFKTLKKRLFGEEEKAKPTANKNGQLDLFGSPIANTNNTKESTEEEEDTTPISFKNISNTTHNYHLIDTPELYQQLVDYLLVQEEVSFDTETTSIDALQAELVGLSFAYYATEAYYVLMPADKNEAIKILEVFKPFFENTNIRKVGQNIKYDLMVLQNYGITLKGVFFDTMLAHYLLEPESRHNMDYLSEIYLQYTPISIETLIGKKGKGQGNMRDVAIDQVVPYAAEDADVTLQLKNVFEAPIKKNNLEKLFLEVETPLIEVLATMERNGVSLNTKVLAEISKDLEKEVAQLETQIYQLAGETFNIASPKQLGDILFDKLKLDKDAKKTKTGQYATGEEVLTKLAEEHEIVRLITSYREMQKLKSTYVDALPNLLSPLDGKLHTSYNQAVTATGRLSSTNPNLQNIPIRTEKGREIRKAFIPSHPDYVIMAADYSQIELRLMAEFSQDKTMLQAFEDDKDIHTITASKIFKVALDQVDADMRRKAKTTNFGIIYGISAFGLANRLHISRKEASDLIKEYFDEFPAIKKFIETCISKAREQEYVETILGRRRYLPDINSRNATVKGFAERNAVNAPLQGSAADMIKIAMINIHDWMKKEKLQSKLILQVHDELVLEAHKDEKELLKKHVAELMRNALPLKVPMKVEIGFGDNWLEAH